MFCFIYSPPHRLEKLVHKYEAAKAHAKKLEETENALMKELSAYRDRELSLMEAQKSKKAETVIDNTTAKDMRDFRKERKMLKKKEELGLIPAGATAGAGDSSQKVRPKSLAVNLADLRRQEAEEDAATTAAAPVTKGPDTVIATMAPDKQELARKLLGGSSFKAVKSVTQIATGDASTASGGSVQAQDSPTGILKGSALKNNKLQSPEDRKSTKVLFSDTVTEANADTAAVDKSVSLQIEALKKEVEYFY